MLILGLFLIANASASAKVRGCGASEAAAPAWEFVPVSELGGEEVAVLLWISARSRFAEGALGRKFGAAAF
jgi:hypothetical protein